MTDRELELSSMLEKYQAIGDYDRLLELSEADKEGRCIILPAKEVFELTWDAGEGCNLQCPISIDGVSQCDCCDYGELFVYKRKCTQALSRLIGNTVFLTEKEAEAKRFEYLNDRY